MVQIQAAPGTPRVDQKKREILLAAASAFRARGFHATAMRDIAGALGMTASNLYYYFASKQDILAFCQEEALSRLLALARWARGGDGDGEARPADRALYLAIQGHVMALNQGAPGSLAHLEFEALPPASRRRIQKLRDRYEMELHQIVVDGVEEGRFAVEDARVAVLAILGALNWTVRWFRADGRRSAREIGAQMAAQLVRGLLAPGVELDAPGEAPPPHALGEIE